MRLGVKEKEVQEERENSDYRSGESMGGAGERSPSWC